MNSFEEWWKTRQIQAYPNFYTEAEKNAAFMGYNAGLDRAAEVVSGFKSGNKEIVIACGLIAGKIRGEKC